MSLRYYLVPNPLINAAPGSYRAVTITSRSVTLEELHEQMTREGSTITNEQAVYRFWQARIRIGSSRLTPLHIPAFLPIS